MEQICECGQEKWNHPNNKCKEFRPENHSPQSAVNPSNSRRGHSEGKNYSQQVGGRVGKPTPKSTCYNGENPADTLSDKIYCQNVNVEYIKEFIKRLKDELSGESIYDVYDMNTSEAVIKLINKLAGDKLT